MNLFKPRRVECPKGEWTTLISNFGTGIPASWMMAFKSKNAEAVAGTYIEKRHLWIFPQQAVEGQLTTKMEFQRHWINAVYSLKVCPTSDMVVEILRIG